MMKSFFILYFVLCWGVLQCLCDDPPAPGSEEAIAAALKEKGIECNNVSNAVKADADYLLKNVLSKDGTVKVKDGFFIVAHESAAAVTRSTSDKQTTTTHAHLREGISAILGNCTVDDGKISGVFTPKDSKVYKICLTGSEETDDC